MFPSAEANPMDLVANHDVEVDNHYFHSDCLCNEKLLLQSLLLSWLHQIFNDKPQWIRMQSTMFAYWNTSYFFNFTRKKKDLHYIRCIHGKKTDNWIANLLQSLWKYVSVCVIWFRSNGMWTIFRLLWDIHTCIYISFLVHRLLI